VRVRGRGKVIGHSAADHFFLKNDHDNKTKGATQDN
jgi:hypothetical protein